MIDPNLLKRLALLFLAFATLAPLAWPQASTGTVSGTVRDQTGAVIPGAAVSLTNTATNVASKTTPTRRASTSSRASCRGSPLVESAGMKFEGTLTVQVLQSAVVDAVVKVGRRPKSRWRM
jgi:hypothetical protein